MRPRCFSSEYVACVGKVGFFLFCFVLFLNKMNLPFRMRKVDARRRAEGAERLRKVPQRPRTLKAIGEHFS